MIAPWVPLVAVRAPKGDGSKLRPFRLACALQRGLRCVRAGVVVADGHAAPVLNLRRDLDSAVAAAYGWPADISADDALSRLRALNLSRSAA
jgi:hypothetical protein